MTRSSLRLRLVLAGAAAVLVSLALASLGLAALFGAHVERRAMAELSVQLDQVIAGLERDGEGALVLARPPADPRFAQPLGGLYWQIGAEEELLRSRSLWDTEMPLPRDELAAGVVHAHHLAGPAGDPLLVLERSVTLPVRLGGTPVRAAVAMDAAELEAARAAFLRELVPYVALLALALIAAGWVQVSVGLRPLKTVGTRVAAVRSGRSRRVGTDFPAEVRPLAAELDALIEARERDVERARTRAADLAHGLKTPLQAVLGEAERLRRKGEGAMAASLENLVGTMQRHVDRELARARVAAGPVLASCNAAEVARGVVSVVQRTPAGAALDWRVEGAEVRAAIEAADLAEALGAVVENAARHATTCVAVTCSRETGQVQVAVQDDGPGIPADRIDLLTERGRRLDESGNGTGLGLAIAREIVEAAGGRLDFEPAERGLVVRLLLPATRGTAAPATPAAPDAPVVRPGGRHAAE
jgi:signal transduction histidine kinase